MSWNLENEQRKRRHRDVLILQKSISHQNILDARRVRWSKFLNEDQRTLVATVGNLVATATRRLGFVYPSFNTDNHFVFVMYRKCVFLAVKSWFQVDCISCLNVLQSDLVRGCAVGSGTALLVGRLRVLFSMVSLEFFININLPDALWPWGWPSF